MRIINMNNVFHSFPDWEITCPPIKPNTFNILLKMKRDKWFLNSPSKWNMLKGLKNIYDWYLILTFPTVIFFKVHGHYRHELVFFWRFSRPRGALCTNAHYITLNMVSLTFCKIKLNSNDWQCYINRNLLGYSLSYQFTNWPKEKEKE